MRQLIDTTEISCNGDYEYTLVIWKEEGAFFTSKTQGEFNIDTIEGVKLNDEDLFPLANSGISICTSEADIYIKLPNLVFRELYPDSTKRFMMDEIACLEGISRFGTNSYIVQYHGCQVRNGLIVGICLEKCPYKLDDAIDKRMIADVDKFIYKVKLGLEFIHSTGYVHDDIHNGNIMVTETGDPKIIDFDSYKPIGSSRTNKKCGVDDWQRESKIAEVENDLELLPKLAEYIRERIAEQE